MLLALNFLPLVRVDSGQPLGHSSAKTEDFFMQVVDSIDFLQVDLSRRH